MPHDAIMSQHLVGNAAGRPVPAEINGHPGVPFAGVGKYRPEGRKAAPPIRTCADYPADGNKVVKNVATAPNRYNHDEPHLCPECATKL